MTKEQKFLLKPSDILNGMNSDVPAFIGFSAVGPAGEPLEIKRWSQFIVKFGGYRKSGFLATSVNGFFINGGKRCYVLNLGESPEDPEEREGKYEDGLKALDGNDEISLIISPGEYLPGIHRTILDYCGKRGIFALLDGPEELIKTAREVEEEPTGAETDATGGPEEDEGYENMPFVDSHYGTIIYPWIYLKDRVLGNMYMPPTGHIAGVLSRLFNDDERPEFADIQGTVLLKYKFTKEEIEKYRERGISFLEYPTKFPGLMLR